MTRARDATLGERLWALSWPVVFLTLAISCVGLMDLAMDRAAEAGVRTVKTASAEEAARVAVRDVQPGDVVLVKGSRSIGTERIVTALAERSPA